MILNLIVVKQLGKSIKCIKDEATGISPLMMATFDPII